MIGKGTKQLYYEEDIYLDESINQKKGKLDMLMYIYNTFEEGKRLAKIRIRGERIPAIGDKFSVEPDRKAL